MTTTKGNVRENHVVEFEEGRLIAWRPVNGQRDFPVGGQLISLLADT